ncbi:hypothetical protein SARC_10587 [Sphaeroforma arctica JP610]|uniref:Uncharacterized protein n=1 Tax=Sphaeroforma arctica JP610 TaxID=667725 RepID=A0A0L0FKD6_9EUKA|nr:hypothetical protein SARC_10587 [Sphaeroforma arctica JP610]KNC76936.1 hypothetical protein SARC_10587 [Sphaeroforma arctica JP610]|eukprot:XP_014150838.1 hypothetical protein SARC_10587 [Sphaeroforma arctica JP610]
MPPQYGNGQESSIEIPVQDDDTFKVDPSVWEDEAVRKGFVKKVYSLLSIMLLFTSGVIAFFVYTPGVRDWVLKNSWINLVAMVLAIGILLGLACTPGLARKAPQNFIMLGLFTFFEAIAIGVICCYYDTEEVMMAFGITCFITIGITIFAAQTKIDFTPMAGGLCLCLFALLGFGFFCIFFGGQVTHIIYCTIGAILFGLFLLVDTQRIMGGKHKQQIHPEEYVFAALNLFLDIINIFLMILQLIGAVGE